MWAALAGIAARAVGGAASRGVAAKVGEGALSRAAGSAAEKGASNLLSNAQKNNQSQGPRPARTSSSVTDIPSYRTWGE